MLLRNNALVNNPYLYDQPEGPEGWSQFIRALNKQEVFANITIDSSGFIRMGQTAYDTGTGFWMGDVSGTPKFSLGNSSGNKLTWDGSSLGITGVLNLANTASTFTASWSGFTADPGGTVSYINLGAVVILYVTAAITGASNSTAMSLDNLPPGARPPSYAVGSCLLVDNGVVYTGAWARAGLSSLVFQIDNVSGTKVTLNAVGFTAGGTTKGIPAGFCIIFPT